MKIFKAVFASILFGFLLSMNAFAAQPLNKVVAIVNDGIITQDELNQAIRGVQARMQQAHAAMPPADKLRSEVLNQLILQKMQLQIAKRAGVKISNAELNDAISNIAKSNHISVSELKQKIKSSGASIPEFEKNIRQQMLLTKLQRSAVAEQIKVTDPEINAALIEIKQKLSAAQQFQLLDVVVPVANKEIVPQIKSDLQKNVATSTLTKQFPSATFNDMGWQNPNTLPELFLSSLKNAHAHEVIGPIHAPNGLHLLKVVATKSGPQQQITRDQAKMYVMQQKSQAVLQKWLEKMRKSAYVKIISQ